MPAPLLTQDDLLRIIARQERELEAWETRYAALEARYGVLEARNVVLEARVAELEAQLGKDSSNSHKPPSSDMVKPPKPPRKPGTRAKGGQPGHEGTTRLLVDAERVDVVVPCLPPACSDCGHSLAGAFPDRPPTRHQVAELPEIRATVTEYQLHWLVCPGCQAATRGQLPDGMRKLAFGPRFIALVTLLLGRHLGSHRRVCELLQDLTGLDIAVGSVTNLLRFAADALDAPYQSAVKALQRALVAYVDETGWRDQETGKPWLWVGVCASAIVFQLHGRSRAGKNLLLGSFSGTLVSDRLAAYGDHPVEDRQICQAHLKRDFKALVALKGEAARFGKELLGLQKTLFGLYYRREAGKVTLEGARDEVEYHKRRWRRCLERGLEAKHDSVYTLCKSLLKLFPALFVFVEEEGVDGTNNKAEQALRPAVIKRKVSLGTAGDTGRRFLERALTVISTCRQQGQNVFDFLVLACQAAFRRQPAPILLQTT